MKRFDDRIIEMQYLRSIIAWTLVLMTLTLTATAQPVDEDPYLWLEEVNGAGGVAYGGAQKCAPPARLARGRDFFS